jgi:hypothetical protein
VGESLVDEALKRPPARARGHSRLRLPVDVVIGDQLLRMRKERWQGPVPEDGAS